MIEGFNQDSVMQTKTDTLGLSAKPTKTPWHLRFAPGALNLKEMAATAGIGTIYGLLIVGIFLMPVFWMRASQVYRVPPCSWLITSKLTVTAAMYLAASSATNNTTT